MTTTQQPEALNLEEFRAKVTCAAREPLLARIAELEAQPAAIGAGGVEPLRKSTAAPQAVQAAVPVNLDFGTLREIVNGLHRAWGDAQGYAYCPGSEPYIEARQRAMRMHAGALRYIESMESYAAPAHPAEGVPVQVVELEVDDLID